MGIWFYALLIFLIVAGSAFLYARSYISDDGWFKD